MSAGCIKDDYFKWNIVFEGPSDSLYEGGVFHAIMDFPGDYPLKPPEMKFVTKMWHPNIHEDGKVCISILHPAEHDQFNEQERLDEKWRPVLGVQEIILSVISMLNHPNTDSPANVDASVDKVLTQIEYRNNQEAYKKRVRKLVRDTQEG